MTAIANRQNELAILRRSCNLDCFAVTVRDHCDRCGENTIQCLTHGWKLQCRCERECEAAMQAEADAYYQQWQEDYERDELKFDRLAMGM